MTASKGLKILRDSITYTREDMDAMSRHLYEMDSLFLRHTTKRPLLPFHPLCDEYEEIQAVIALSPDDVGNNILIAAVQGDGRLRINYEGQTMFLSPTSTVIDRYEKWSGIEQTFTNDAVEIQVKGYRSDSLSQKYTPGLGYFYCRKEQRLVSEEKVYLLYRRDYLATVRP